MYLDQNLPIWQKNHAKFGTFQQLPILAMLFCNLWQFLRTWTKTCQFWHNFGRSNHAKFGSFQFWQYLFANFGTFCVPGPKLANFGIILVDQIMPSLAVSNNCKFWQYLFNQLWQFLSSLTKICQFWHKLIAQIMPTFNFGGIKELPNMVFSGLSEKCHSWQLTIPGALIASVYKILTLSQFCYS